MSFLIEINVWVESKIYVTCWQSVFHSLARGTNFWQNCLPSALTPQGERPGLRGGWRWRRRTEVVMKTIYMRAEWGETEVGTGRRIWWHLIFRISTFIGTKCKSAGPQAMPRPVPVPPPPVNTTLLPGRILWVLTKARSQWSRGN
jgi:hypothetical protein